ncbi:hypothetical protein [Massilia varians]|uniref:hypothetical protein n=1 Tax=Massilia varians TaxID=457921 RepID=UPI002554EEC9|nr:hypothetical protein [Massilia varians]MDK6078961.1 hypothetical protein [Massilia varians]
MTTPTETTDLDLDKLEALAKAVPEHIQLKGWFVGKPQFGHQHVYADDFRGQGRQHIASLPAGKQYFGSMAGFIAAANPAVILKLIALARRTAAPVVQDAVNPLKELISSSFGWQQPRQQYLTAVEVIGRIGCDKPTKQQVVHVSQILKSLAGEPMRTTGGRLFHLPPDSPTAPGAAGQEGGQS